MYNFKAKTDASTKSYRRASLVLFGMRAPLEKRDSQFFIFASAISDIGISLKFLMEELAHFFLFFTQSTARGLPYFSVAHSMRCKKLYEHELKVRKLNIVLKSEST